MCKRHTPVMERAPETHAGPYEGETVRLGAHDATWTEHRRRWHAFPWWTLWMIWPLIGLVKVLVAALATAFDGLAPLVAGGAWGVWPLLLIVVGLVLLRRR